MSIASTAVLAAQVLVGLVALAAGAAKLTGQQSQVEEFDRFRYPQWFRTVTGSVEGLAGVALLAGAVAPAAVSIAGGLLAAGVMAGAVVTHFRIDDPLSKVAAPVLLFSLAAVVVVARLQAVAA